MKNNFRAKPRGWRGESHRHYLAAKGISTRYFTRRGVKRIEARIAEFEREQELASPGMRAAIQFNIDQAKVDLENERLNVGEKGGLAPKGTFTEGDSPPTLKPSTAAGTEERLIQLALVKLRIDRPKDAERVLNLKNQLPEMQDELEQAQDRLREALGQVDVEDFPEGKDAFFNVADIIEQRRAIKRQFDAEDEAEGEPKVSYKDSQAYQDLTDILTAVQPFQEKVTEAANKRNAALDEINDLIGMPRSPKIGLTEEQLTRVSDEKSLPKGPRHTTLPSGNIRSTALTAFEAEQEKNARAQAAIDAAKAGAAKAANKPLTFGVAPEEKQEAIDRSRARFQDKPEDQVIPKKAKRGAEPFIRRNK